MVDNQSGAVLAYHGGRDYTKRQYDAIKDGARPTGTAILPFLYATALTRAKAQSPAFWTTPLTTA